MILIRRLLSCAIVLMLLLMLVVPALIARGCVGGPLGRRPRTPGIPVTVSLYRHDTKTVVKMDLEEYLIGVLAAEVPATFEEEALRAQAIVARTYTVKRLRCFGGPGTDCHPEADLCDDPAHGQAWLSEEDAKARWGVLNGARYWARLAAAVADTQSQVIMYKGLLIETAYHSTCGGQTEDSGNVWQQSLPYLKSVECKWCQTSPRLHNVTEMTLDEMARRIGDTTKSIPAMAQREGRKVIEILEASPSGRIERLRVGSITARGTDFRAALGLSSTRFGWQVSGSRIRFEAIGFGHGVGLCQYGANGMAKEGHTAGEIIKHYFQGVTIDSMWSTR